MGFEVKIEAIIYFFARARSISQSERSVTAALICIFSLTNLAISSTDLFLRDHSGRIQGLNLTKVQMNNTAKSLNISSSCRWVRSAASAAPFQITEAATIIVRVASQRGAVVLVGMDGETSVALQTALFGPYQNIPRTLSALPKPDENKHYSLALDFAATLVGQGDLKLQRGDSVTVRTDRQLYTIPLPDITIPNEGLLRLYAGTDDALYFDKTLRHPVHAGLCKRKVK